MSSSTLNSKGLAGFRRGIVIAVIITLTFLLCLLASAPAHEVWIEADAEGKPVVRFAEYGEDFEKSPGHLDGLFPVIAWTVDDSGKPRMLETVKKEDGYNILEADFKKPLFVDAGFIVMKRGEGPARKPNFYARWHEPSLGAAKTALNFDIVPTGEGSEVQVYFRGKPLPAAELTVIAPDSKEEQLKADDTGKAKFTITVPGNYLIYAKHQREDVAGFAAGVAYDALSHNCSLYWKQP